MGCNLSPSFTFLSKIKVDREEMVLVYDNFKTPTVANDMVISDNGSSVYNTFNPAPATGHNWSTVYGSEQFNSVDGGVHEWELKIEKLDNSPGNSFEMAVGVAFNETQELEFFPSGGSGFGYIQENGNKSNGVGPSTGYGTAYTVGDTIKVILDFDNNTLDFEKNGVSQGTGVAFSGLPAGVYRLAVSLGDSPDRVKLVNNKIDKNTTDIATNAGNIATNTTDIATNAGNIATNTTDIATNAGNIATNTTDIATNETDIATNKTDIQTNKDNISQNNNFRFINLGLGGLALLLVILIWLGIIPIMN